MSVLSDKSIIMLCTPPTHRIMEGTTVVPAWLNVSHSEREIVSAHGDVLKADDPWVTDFKPMISDFSPTSVKKIDDQRIASYGTSSYGYDIRAAAEFKVFRGFTEDGRIDYKNITDDMFETVYADSVWIPPGGFILARSVEYVHIPRDILAVAIGKSTIARVGINCLVTPLEPEWEGYITLEFSNTTNLANRFYANEGCLQLLFLKGDQECQTSYADRGGKYNHQAEKIILPRV